MSGYSDNVINKASSPIEDAHFIQKPFSVDAPTAKVRLVLDETTRK